MLLSEPAIMKIDISDYCLYLTDTYREKVKAYLRAGARALRGGTYYPNDRIGLGRIVRESWKGFSSQAFYIVFGLILQMI